MNEPKAKPTKEFRAGKMKASVWSSESVQNGRAFVQFSIRIKKSYYDKKTGQWTDSTSFFPEELPYLVMVAQKAFEYVALRETPNGNGSAKEIPYPEDAPDFGQGN